MSDRLLSLLTELSFERRNVVLASGRESDWFLDCKQAVLTAEGHALVGAAMLEALDRLATRPAAVAGVELGGCPLASAVALISHQRGAPLDAVYVRKSVKDHGSRRQLEGDGRLTPGTRIAVLEDVVTTGGSTLAAVEKLRARELDVVGVIALVDRGEGGREALAAADLPLVALYGRQDFMQDTAQDIPQDTAED
ncbi:MAG: orotate phosphoribosyltransferase [Deltaproteobacteria bacterium]|nr:MAG: orotate phosphoribosyltransferase [Deltaproteobacteria bacterium]